MSIQMCFQGSTANAIILTILVSSFRTLFFISRGIVSKFFIKKYNLNQSENSRVNRFKPQKSSLQPWAVPNLTFLFGIEELFRFISF